MIFLIAGASHTGKTLLAQKLIEKYKFPCLSLDLLKPGLIRSKNTGLTPLDDDRLTDYLWPVAREMIKTAVENKQNLIVEGCYIPFDWKADFDPCYLKEIKHIFLIMSENYIKENFDKIMLHACVIENRKDDLCCTRELLTEDNLRSLKMCKKYGCDYVLIEGDYMSALEKIIREA